MSASPHRATRGALAALALLVVTVLTLAGCGSSSGSSGGANAPLKITVASTTITPTNQRIEVEKGKPLELTIVSDRDGELHVHSSPEQHVEFLKGTTHKTLTFTTPGVIELEEHASDTLIAQLEVT